MYPTLYDRNPQSFVVGLGRGKLRDVMNCTVHEEVNGDYSLTFDYPISGPMYQELLAGGTIGAVVPFPGRTNAKVREEQWFDIVKHETTIEGVTTFTALHISRRLANCVCVASNLAFIDDAWGSAYPAPTTENLFFDDEAPVLIHPEAVSLPGPKSALACLIGDDDSFAANDGIEFTFYTSRDAYISQLQRLKVSVVYQTQRGADRGASVRFGVNMIDLERDIDNTGTYNALVPYWDDGNGNKTFVTGYVVQPTTPISPVIAVPFDLSNEFQDQPTEAEMIQAAQNHLDTQTPWIGADSLEVDLVNGEGITHNGIDNAQLGDTVHVYWGDAGISKDMRIVEYDYDVLTERYSYLRLGTPQTQFVEVTGDATGAGGSVLPEFVVESVSGTAQSVAGGANYSGSFDCAKANYRPLAFAGFSTNSAACSFARLNLNGTTITFNMRNNTSTASSAKPEVWVVYQKI